MLASSWLRLSMLNGCSTLIILSSAGARLIEPPQTMQAPILFTIFFILSTLKETFVSTSTVSAVPAGLVIDLDDVFGTVRPAAARIGTIIIVVLLPATPPTQCLSMTGFFLSFNTSPVAIIAFVRSMVSLKVMTFVWHADTK